MLVPTLRRLASGVRRTPLHPQWLMGSKEATARWVAQHACGRILDIGCADRWIERRLPAGSDYFGLDYPVTGKLMYAARPHVFADASALPFADASMDTVVILEVMEHLERPREALREIARVLRPKGRVMLSMPFLYPIHDAPHDYQRLTVHGLTRDATAAGLRVDAVVPTLHSAEAAGLIVCLSIGGMAIGAIRQRSLSIVLLPLLLVAIPLVNIVAWTAARLLPSWDAVTEGYRLLATNSTIERTQTP